MRFNRWANLIGEDKLNLLKHKEVMIFGLGGVGSFAFEAIVRSGVEKIIVVDFDKVDITNLNRQLLALESTIGMYKTDVAEQRAKDINPEIRVLSYPVKANRHTIPDLMDMDPDFIVDCIDDIEAKVLIIEQAQRRDIPFISSMGFANKTHPEMTRIATLAKTNVCPLAKTLRKRLKDEGISLDFPVIFSSETPKKTVEKEVLGTSSYCPSTAGLYIASYVINKMIGD